MTMRASTVVPMVVMAAFGLAETILFWPGLVAWCRFCNLPYAQVKGTPYEDMWTSLRGATGVLILMMVLIWLVTTLRCRTHQPKPSSNQSVEGTGAEPLSSDPE